MHRSTPATLLLMALTASALAAQPLSPPPVPPQNPITEAKRVLGKILFWEEQLSTDDTIACGTCHRPAQGGADPRAAIHPGPDATFGTDDDIMGSAGVVRRNVNGDPIEDPLFGFEPQVTPRTAPSVFTAGFAPEIFWDGRARQEFRDPETGVVLIPNGGALENQAVEAILSPVEMAKEGRTWDDVRAKLGSVVPLGLAADLPPDVATAISNDGTYGELFAAAYGTPAITGARIAMAIATYERTLVPNQTPFDLGTLTPEQQQGFATFETSRCGVFCHAPPLFSDNTFRNVGVRPHEEDIGRQAVTELAEDRGRFKMPSLRNVALRPRFMHNGVRTALAEVFEHYGDPASQLGDNVDPLLPVTLPDGTEDFVMALLFHGLTDPRVEAETFPFDRPTLRSEMTTGVATAPASPRVRLRVSPNPFTTRVAIQYELTRASRVDLTILDVMGRRVRTLLDREQSPGDHVLSWDGRNDVGDDVGSGVYYYRLSFGANERAGAIVLRR